MKDFSFSTGIVGYPMNGTVLRVNLSDQNFYNRFMSIKEELKELEKEYTDKTKNFEGELDVKGFPVTDSGKIDTNKLSEEQKEILNQRAETTLTIMTDIDNRIKRKLEDAFGNDNDFDKIFQGVNVMAFDIEGNRILSNFFDIITPEIEKSSNHIDNDADKLVGNREQRRTRNNRV